jgi:hypothetical protein
MQLANLSFSNFYEYFTYLADAKKESNWNPYFGIVFSFTIPVISKRLGVLTNLEFAREKFNYSYNDQYEAFTSIFYNYTALQINFNYSLRSGKIFALPYFGIGFNFLYNYKYTGWSSPDNYQIPFTLNPLRINLNAGLSFDIPLSIDKGIHLRPSFDYKIAFKKSIKDIHVESFNYKYSAMGISVILLKYF